MIKEKDSNIVLTVWFGKEIDVEFAHQTVHNLQKLGFIVRAPFYIGYNLNTDFVRTYLKSSLDRSDYLYVIGYEGSLMEDIIEYAHQQNKPLLRKESFTLCC